MNTLDEMGDLFLGQSFLLQVFLFGTIFIVGGGVWSFVSSFWTRC